MQKTSDYTRITKITLTHYIRNQLEQDTLRYVPFFGLKIAAGNFGQIRRHRVL